jgi:beta-lactamase superfamily II metal-dependent hydrolase
MSPTTIEIRMYNVGFGDAFRVTVRDGSDVWRMLVDCGKHTASADGRPIADTVRTLIADLAEDCGGTPQLDVLVATHRHQDHISGFACEEWQHVGVESVWLPFVEDLEDPDATVLRNRQARAAHQLQSLITDRLALAVADSAAARNLLQAQAFAVNSSGNAAATDRLLGRNGKGFANPHRVRFFPRPETADDAVDIGRCGIVAHVLGPSRDPAMLTQMDPPSRAGWLRLNLDDDATPNVGDSRQLFALQYTVCAEDIPDDLRATQKALALSPTGDGMDLLAAAAVLEHSVNNTSLFFVLDVGGFGLLFPGDAQYGAWQHVRSDPAARALINTADFYKVGHHGSHNATPKDFVLTDWHTEGDAMVPWGLVERWKATIPKRELIAALGQQHHAVVFPTPVPATVDAVPPRGSLVQNDHWTQLTFTV